VKDLKMTSKRLAAALLLVGLFAAGCGSNEPTGPDVADLETPTASSSAQNKNVPKDPKARAIAYSKCMRSNGVKAFPDPDSEGNIKLHAEPGNGMDANDPTFQAADKACKYLMPGPSDLDRDKIRAANLKYSKCMRDNGIKGFPDPKADGTLQIENEMGGELDPTNPKYQAAEKACEKYMPDGGGKKSLEQGNG
jgi:hypothetical protein